MAEAQWHSLLPHPAHQGSAAVFETFCFLCQSRAWWRLFWPLQGVWGRSLPRGSAQLHRAAGFETYQSSWCCWGRSCSSSFPLLLTLSVSGIFCFKGRCSPSRRLQVTHHTLVTLEAEHGLDVLFVLLLLPITDSAAVGSSLVWVCSGVGFMLLQLVLSSIIVFFPSPGGSWEHARLSPDVPSLQTAGELEQWERCDAGLACALQGRAVQGAAGAVPAVESSQWRRLRLQEAFPKHTACPWIFV